MEGVDLFFSFFFSFFPLFFLLILKRKNRANISMFMLCLVVLSIFIQRKEFFFGFEFDIIKARSLPMEAS